MSFARNRISKVKPDETDVEEDQHISHYSCAYNKVPEKENDFNEKQVNFCEETRAHSASH